MSICHYDPRDIDFVFKKIQDFWRSKGMLESYPANRLSILAACEDPRTVATVNYNKQVWPLSQTLQMWAEHDLLTNPELPGLFSFGTSYRQEPNPVVGRHNLAFCLMEFERPGTTEDCFEELLETEAELLKYLGYTPGEDGKFPRITYDEACKKYGVERLDHEHEEKLCEELGPVVFLTDFPNDEAYWNMKMDKSNPGYTKKCDVLLSGIETIGSAERSCDVAEMREQFHANSEGGYAALLYEKFTKERVEAEMDVYLGHNFIPRYGGGIGLDRLIKSMKKCGLMPDHSKKND